MVLCPREDTQSAQAAGSAHMAAEPGPRAAFVFIQQKPWPPPHWWVPPRYIMSSAPRLPRQRVIFPPSASSPPLVVPTQPVLEAQPKTPTWDS